MELLLPSISWVLITSVVSNLNYFDHLNYLEFLTTSSQLQKQKTINFSTQIQNYFLTSFSWAVVTFVVPNLSHSDCLNLPVTVDKLLATKKKGQSYFAYLANKTNMELRTSASLSSSSFLSINTTAFWLPMAHDNQQSARGRRKVYVGMCDARAFTCGRCGLVWSGVGRLAWWSGLVCILYPPPSALWTLYRLNKEVGLRLQDLFCEMDSYKFTPGRAFQVSSDMKTSFGIYGYILVR